MFKFLSLIVFLGACFVQGNTAEAPRSFICDAPNAYYPIADDCDGYVQCKEGHADQMLCPDGLHFNPRAIYPDYPCSYPTEVSCEGRGAPQPAKPTEDCPHQYGFFPSMTKLGDNCGTYCMCVAGDAMEMMCAPGLAFNPLNTRCDWPDLVSGCDVERFLRFTCPPAPRDEKGEPIEVVNYPHDEDCYRFYSCVRGHPRLLTCDTGFAFDASSGHCVDELKAPCFKKARIH